MGKDKTGRTFERRVADLFRALGAWKVEHDVLMAGHQIDVYVETAGPAGSLHRLAVEAKDWQSPVGINVVGRWALVVDDLRRAGLIDEGVVVSPAGFTKPARREATERASRGLPIRLLELADLLAAVERSAATVDLDRLRQEYLAFLVNSYRRLDFRGIVQTRNPVELDLADVYVSLNVAPSGGRPVEPGEVLGEAALRKQAARAEWLRVEDVLREEPRLVVLGDPGAGKTTFLRYVALALAEEERAARERLGLSAEWLPIYLPLAAYNQEFQQRRVSLEDYVLHYWDTRSFDRPGMDQLVARVLEAGQALLLLDGLDEVGSRADRRATISQVEAWTNSYAPRGNRVVVSSRSVGYDEAPLACDFRAYTLSPFGPDEIERFARQWCVAYQRWADSQQPLEMARQKGLDEAGRLVAEIRADSKVESLAANPLLVTIIALIHYFDVLRFTRWPARNPGSPSPCRAVAHRGGMDRGRRRRRERPLPLGPGLAREPRQHERGRHRRRLAGGDVSRWQERSLRRLGSGRQRLGVDGDSGRREMVCLARRVVGQLSVQRPRARAGDGPGSSYNYGGFRVCSSPAGSGC